MNISMIFWLLKVLTLISENFGSSFLLKCLTGKSFRIAIQTLIRDLNFYMGVAMKENMAVIAHRKIVPGREGG